MGQSGEHVSPFRRLSKTIKEHLGGIIAFLQSRMANETIEAINGLIQLAKMMARGFRSFRSLRIAAFLKAGKLRLDLPALPTSNSEEAQKSNRPARRSMLRTIRWPVVQARPARGYYLALPTELAAATGRKAPERTS